MNSISKQVQGCQQAVTPAIHRASTGAVNVSNMPGRDEFVGWLPDSGLVLFTS